MAKAKSNKSIINGKEYYRITRTVGRKYNADLDIWVDDKKQFYGKTKKEAEAKYKAYLDNESSDKYKSMALGEVMDNWISEVFRNDNRIKDSTKALYLNAYTKYFRDSKAAKTKISQLENKTLQSFYNSSDIPSGPLKALSKLINRFFKWAALTGVCKNITTEITIPVKNEKNSIPKTIETWSIDDLKVLESALEGTTLKFFVVLAVNTGARMSELLALEYKDIKDGILHINKQIYEGTTPISLTSTKSPSSVRDIPLSDHVLEELNKHKIVHSEEMKKNHYKSNLIFSSNTGQYHYRSNVRMSLKRTCDRIGIDWIKPHAFRATFATNCAKSGVPIDVLAALMGHADTKETLKYYDSIDNDRKKAAVEKIAMLSI